MRRRLLIAAAFAALAITGTADAKPRPRVYSVIFEVTVDEAGKVATLKVSKVIEPATGSLDAVKVDVPEVFVEAVRVELLKRTYEPSPKPFFTYMFYDPRFPDKPNITIP
ncbi:hypothetical protein QO010_000322 [Caulobacter ginsengisoli]|uniref:TonB C-terminal domain-containing protein n=1 Tax=Caulobacter ginsengisoli TaxID=400775 RepID=A0ABU0IKU1_9CAUL|nr:hypothetical protein [Caulobacter ginsengisoli]MDQ0462574.1 hypothetical protein [Caulobacter ginsengisoli]